MSKKGLSYFTWKFCRVFLFWTFYEISKILLRVEFLHENGRKLAQNWMHIHFAKVSRRTDRVLFISYLWLSVVEARFLRFHLHGSKYIFSGLWWKMALAAHWSAKKCCRGRRWWTTEVVSASSNECWNRVVNRIKRLLRNTVKNSPKKSFL